MVGKFVLVLLLGSFLTGDCAKWSSRFKIYIVPHGETAIMTCSVETAPFVGFFDSTGKAINASKKYQIKPDGNNYVLEMFKVEESDYGEYMCKDSASEDTSTLEIDVQVEQLLPQNLAVGYKGTIKAEVYGMPRKQMEWFKNGKKISSLDSQGKMIFNDLNRYKVDPRGSLIIEEVLKNDKGIYELKIVKESSRITKSVEIDVGYKPIIITSPADLYTKTAGQVLSIPCQWNLTDSKPTWTFTPTGSNQSTVVDQSQIDVAKLTIAAVATNDEGKYVCSASNKYGKSEIFTQIASVITPAAITSKFESTKQLINTNFNVDCIASGRPVPKVTIHHLGKELTSGLGVANTSVVISASTAGDYKCSADNGALAVDGSSLQVEKKMTLEMLTPPIIKQISDDLSSAVGLSFAVQCIAIGNPTPKVTLQQEGENLASVKSTVVGQMNTVEFSVDSAVAENIKDITCMATNDHGVVNKTVKITEVVRADPPTDLARSGKAGLKYIVLTWKKSVAADSYLIYVNDTRSSITVLETDKTVFQVQGLDQNTFYLFEVASVNIAGIGANASVVLATSDISPPGNVTNIQLTDLSFNTVLVKWDPPKNVEGIDITYRISYCMIVNDTLSGCHHNSDQKDDSFQFSELNPGTSYQVQIAALNQKVVGRTTRYNFTTLDQIVTPKPPSQNNRKKGMATGAIAGIIIAIIIIILLVVDLFCCFFNQCGFSHCCVETLCANNKSSDKYKSTKEHKDEEMEELKPKSHDVV